MTNSMPAFGTGLANLSDYLVETGFARTEPADAATTVYTKGSLTVAVAGDHSTVSRPSGDGKPGWEVVFTTHTPFAVAAAVLRGASDAGYAPVGYTVIGLRDIDGELTVAGVLRGVHNMADSDPGDEDASRFASWYLADDADHAELLACEECAEND